MNPQEFERKLTAILSADVAGYSRLMAEDEDLTIRTLTGHREMMATLIGEHKGRVVDSPGDNLLAVFSSVTRAVDCAVEIQREMAERNEELPDDRKMEYRIGVNLGDVIKEGDRIYGDGVNIAARLESLAEPGGICISGVVYSQVKNRLKLEYEFMGHHSVKNIREPVPVYRVLSFPGDAAHRVIKVKETAERSWRNTAIITVVALVVVLGILAVWNFYPRGSSIQPASIEPEQISLVPDMKEAPKTIAVLPFDDLSPGKDQDYFVVGLTEEILNCLAQIPDLIVIAKTSSFSFKGTNKTIQEIANELGVDHILEGSVRKAGNALRISAQLIKAVDDSHIWSETYDKEFKVKEIFTVQEDIATAVADKLKVTLGIGKPIKQLGGTDNFEAYEFYLTAKGQLYDLDSLALKSIDAAISLEPEYALAWALKSMVHFMLASFFSTTDRTAREVDAALESALRAIELEPRLGQAYLSLGTAYMMKREFIEAGLAYRNGMKLTTELTDYFEYGLSLFYQVVGHLSKCNELVEEVWRKDPLKPEVRSTYILSLGYLGDMERAEEEYARGRSLFGDQWDMGNEVITLLRLGFGDAISRDDVVYSTLIFNAAKEHLDSPKEGLSELHTLYSDYNKLNERDITDISILAAYFRDPEFAMDAMEKGTEANVMGLFKIWTPVMREVRQLPRFKEFLREIGLVDYWNRFGWPDNNICRPIGDDDFECD